MGKSFKKEPVNKVKGWNKDKYWKQVRNATKNIIRSKDIEELTDDVLPDPKEIINDYDYTDYVSNCIDEHDCRCMRLYGNQDKCKRK